MLTFDKKQAIALFRRFKEISIPLIQDKPAISAETALNKIHADLKKNTYFPNDSYGYLGTPKSFGCTRFVPILNENDLLLYYLIVISLQENIYKEIDGVFGGWRIKPKSVKDGQDNALEFDPYFFTLSPNEWFKKWTTFIEIVDDFTGTKSKTRFVGVTDIANFYDSIDIGMVCNKIDNSVNDKVDHTRLLRFFLQYWDRKVNRYFPSSKGIPQEIVGDASRLIANFYLQEFDEKFKKYCGEHDVDYVRWADDIILFSTKKLSLENAIHTASRILLSIGLNLNASKTRIFTKREYRSYRAVDLLNARKDKNPKKFSHQLKKFAEFSKTHGGRIDTVIRATIGYWEEEPKIRNTVTKHFIENSISNPQILLQFNHKQLLQIFKFYDWDRKKIRKISDVISKYPYAYSKTELLWCLSKYKKQFYSNNISKATLISICNEIEKTSQDSVLIKDICIPRIRPSL